MNILIIANKMAGNGTASERVPALIAALEQLGGTVDLQWTSHRGHAKSIAHAFDQTAIDRLVVVGGDGTVSEVINGLTLPVTVPIAIFGIGSQNVLARELQLPTNITDLAKIIVAVAAAAPRRLVDLGVIDGQTRFLSLCAAGMDARVIRTIEEQRTSTLGSFGYLKPFLRTLFTYAAPEMEVIVDNGEPVTGHLVLVCNIQHYLWHFKPADRAQCDSGMLDVVVLHQKSVFAMCRYLWLARRQRLSGAKGVTYLQGTSIRIDSAHEADVQYDGEYLGTLPVSISLYPNPVPFISPSTR